MQITQTFGQEQKTYFRMQVSKYRQNMQVYSSTAKIKEYSNNSTQNAKAHSRILNAY